MFTSKQHREKRNLIEITYNNRGQTMKENIETSVKRFIRVPDVLNRVGFSRTTLYERIKEGNFPDRVKIGPRCVAFVESEIDEWIEVTIRHSRQNAA
ncbi:transcriptional regulator, AlpA family [Escherichia coli MS 153-1]|nr:transcriptional regulator, AlpA family [Escherichia coli MS 45-1]EFU46118.1 transcriptional regulator, AlpA family [Escherichia coli MS 110-3]EFU49611.1 transcriptional regulator, AlpA family [Escherichia coli MS 153-1]